MSKSTISTFELFQMFPDAEAARVYMEGKRWPDGAVCPACDEANRITTRKGGFYRCNACKTDFTVRTATIFERSKAPLHKWLAALAIVAERPDIASYDLGEVLGLTQKTGWLMLKRIHDALGPMFEANMAATGDRRIIAAWPAYSVTRDGEVWTRYRPGRGGRLGYEWRALNPTPDKDGYRMVRLYRKGGAWMQARACRLVCEAFHGPSEGREARHLNGRNTDDRAVNLAWGTSAENSADTFRHQTQPLGEGHHNATLTDAQVDEIRSLKGRMRQREIAERFGITQGYVSEIHSGARRRLTYKALIA
jgi:transposase-like protein